MDRRCDIPEQVLFDVLLWLPVMSLLQFKSVCKSWRALIESSIFISQHLSLNNGKDNLISSYSGKDWKIYFRLISGSKYEVCITLDFEQNWCPVGEIQLVDSSNGIVCLHNFDSGDVALWNPAMKQFRPLPESPVPRQSFVEGGGVGMRNKTHVAFGFDVKTDDYKVVRINLNTEGMNRPGNQVEVYNLSTDSWRIIGQDAPLPVTYIFPSIEGKCKDGTCFWIGCDGVRNDGLHTWILLSFDLHGEVFGMMSVPDEQVYHAPYALDFLGNKIAYINGRRNDTYNIWVLHEYGVKESWIKMYSVNMGPKEFIWPIGLTKNGEFLIVIKRNHEVYEGRGCLHLYNLGTQEEEYLQVKSPGSDCCSDRFQFTHYHESLVSVKK